MIGIDNKHLSDIPQVPGVNELLDHGISLPAGLFLLIGSPGVGKTMYSRQFILDGLRNNDTCAFISSSITENQFKLLFSGTDQNLIRNLKFLKPCGNISSRRDSPAKILGAIKILESAKKGPDKSEKRKQREGSTRLVVDSLTHMSLICGERFMLKFISGLSALVRENKSIAICTLATSEQRLRDTLSAFAEGILEMRLEENDSKGSLRRGLRLLSIKGIHHDPHWIDFTISNNGDVNFGGHSASVPTLSCTLCGKTIGREPITESDLVFDTRDCVETYKKLASAYGMDLADTGLTSRAFNVSFFFVDIVGLSDPAMSVKKQIQKIEMLNKMISSCDSFKKSTQEKKIIFPTGDGMAIGFLLNPELPLELGIELHRKLHLHNRDKSEEDHVQVRIGLASGPVFRVTDMNNVQNVWGPGIILARRVMDAGDGGHILLADKLAEELIALKDEYRSMIKPISLVYEIKHGQKITLYSAYSDDFGNPELPARVPRIH